MNAVNGLEALLTTSRRFTDNAWIATCSRRNRAIFLHHEQAVGYFIGRSQDSLVCEESRVGFAVQSGSAIWIPAPAIRRQPGSSPSGDRYMFRSVTPAAVVDRCGSIVGFVD